MPHGPANFQTIVVKPYFTNANQTSNPTSESTPEVANPNEATPNEMTPKTAPVQRGPTRPRKLPAKYTNIADEIFIIDEVFITRKEQVD
jgi:hypothetical protein